MPAGEFRSLWACSRAISTGKVAGAERSADVIRSPETDPMTQGPETCVLNPGQVWGEGAKRVTSGCDSTANGTG